MSIETMTTPASTALVQPEHAMLSHHSLLVAGEVVLVGALLIGGFRYLYRKLF